MKLTDVKPLEYNLVLENMVLLNMGEEKKKIEYGRREEKKISEE